MSKNEIRKDAGAWLCYLLAAAALCWPFLWEITFGLTGSDFLGHMKTLVLVLRGDVPWPAHIGLYLSSAVFAGFSPVVESVVFGGTVTVCLAMALKAVILLWQGQKLANGEGGRWGWVLASLALLVAFCIPNPWLQPLKGLYFIGNLSPNIWHNPTAMLLMPFAMVQFVCAFRWLESGKMKSAIGIVVWGLLATLMKPSYLLVFLPAFGLMVLLYRESRSRVWTGLGVCLFLGMALLAQKSIVDNDGGMAPLQFGFFEVMSYYHRHTPWPAMSILLSYALALAYPVSALIARPELRRDLLVCFAFLQFGVGLSISALIHEGGPRLAHGNFAWQNFVCLSLLYWAVTIRLLQSGAFPRFPRLILILHVLSGFIYLARVLIRHSHL